MVSDRQEQWAIFWCTLLSPLFYGEIPPVVCQLYGRSQEKTYKSFLATYRPTGGLIRVVLVRESGGWRAFFCVRLTRTRTEMVFWMERSWGPSHLRPRRNSSRAYPCPSIATPRPCSSVPGLAKPRPATKQHALVGA